MENRIVSLLERKDNDIISIYFTAGYPNLDDTKTIISALENHGADLIEIGMPFSDPVADGPVIQHSSEMALKNGMTIHLLLEQLKDIRKHVSIPLILMGYLNLVMQLGVEDFVKKTNVDSLAISIGTSHGANKFKPEQCTKNADGVLIPPPLRFDILEEIEKRIAGFPIVLHGASSVPAELVQLINANGGKLKDAVGIPEEQLRRAAKSAVCKINIDSDGRLAMTAAVRKVFVDSPGEFDPRKYLGPARDALKVLYKHKIVNVLGSNDKA